MRILAVAISLLIIALFAGPSAAQNVLQQLKDNCSREWGLNFRMIEYCQTRQIAAGRTFVAIQNGEATQDPYRVFLATCYQEWSSRTKTDWRMIVYCYNRQVEAYERLQQQ